MIRGRYLTSMDDLTDVLTLRRTVFGEELGIAARAVRDRGDDMAVYALAFDEENAPTATGRLWIDEDDRFRIGCLCVRQDKRGRGYGDLVVRMLLDRATQLGAGAVYVESLPDAVPFYARYGFRALEQPGEAAQMMRVDAEEIALAGACGQAGTGCAQCGGCGME